MANFKHGRPQSSFHKIRHVSPAKSPNDSEEEIRQDAVASILQLEDEEDNDQLDEYIRQIFDEEAEEDKMDNEEFSQFNLSDIPEISSALEKLNERPALWMNSSSSKPRLHDSECSSEADEDDGMSKPWLVTSCIPKLPFNEEAEEVNSCHEQSLAQLERQDSDDWIRVDLTQGSTFRVERGFKSPEDMIKLKTFDSPHGQQQPSSNWVFLSIEDLTKHSYDVKGQQENLVGAVRNKNTGSLIEILKNPQRRGQIIVKDTPLCNVYLLCKIFALLVLFATLLCILMLIVFYCNGPNSLYSDSRPTRQPWSETFTRLPSFNNFTTLSENLTDSIELSTTEIARPTNVSQT